MNGHNITSALTFTARAEGRTIPDVIKQLKTRIG